jgi:tight adherence protein B
MELVGLLVAIIAGLAILVMFIGFRALLPQNDMADRMYDVVQAGVGDTGGSRLESAISAKQALQQIDRKFLSRGFGSGIAANLIQADLKLTVTEYVLIVLGATSLGAMLGFAISRHPISALVAGLITFFLPPVFVTWRKAKRRRLFAEQLPEALTQLSGSLRAGYSLVQSLDMVTKQMPWPTRDEFLRVVREVQLGQSLDVALDHLSERVTSDDLIMVISSITIHQQVGGNLAEILDTVAETIRERTRIKREVQVLTAQQRISAYVLVVLPIALGAFLMIINPSYEMRLFTPGLTLCIPFGAALSMVVGYFIMRRIVDIDI